MKDGRDMIAFRLPKLVETDPRAEALTRHLRACSQPLWSGSRLEAARIPLQSELRDVLIEAQRAGHLIRGLEACDQALDAEARGQRLVDERSEQRRGVRVSRLLLVSDDGAERFYRQVERTLLRHEGRVLAIRLEVCADELGQLFFEPNHLTRAVMLTRKEAVAQALFAAAP